MGTIGQIVMQTKDLLLVCLGLGMVLVVHGAVVAQDDDNDSDDENDTKNPSQADADIKKLTDKFEELEDMMDDFKKIYRNTTVQKKQAEELKKKYCEGLPLDKDNDSRGKGRQGRKRRKRRRRN
eukprot:TRINITY_DN7267_c0_g1_i2.p1 TRINITY_DN7267_c0_g1~~TRINITY_DN7267_c0_g1_i2.p1  ORF type:complete len:139 (-),score=67.47 TRINITY_DN7267_c0_g1_i2:110-481(-)